MARPLYVAPGFRSCMVRCSDEPPTESTAYAVEGIAPDIAIAVGDTPDEVVYVTVDPDKDVPTEVRELIKGSWPHGAACS